MQMIYESPLMQASRPIAGLIAQKTNVPAVFQLHCTESALDLSDIEHTSAATVLDFLKLAEFPVR